MTMIPSAISEDKVSVFKYWNNNGIQEGMNYKGQLYALVRSYPAEYQLDARELGCDLTAKGIEVCLTCSVARYGVWMNLKSLTVANDRKSAGTSYQLTAENRAIAPLPPQL
jgi:hypothetical protein